jgi:hypothetical protein
LCIVVPLPPGTYPLAVNNNNNNNNNIAPLIHYSSSQFLSRHPTSYKRSLHQSCTFVKHLLGNPLPPPRRAFRGSRLRMVLTSKDGASIALVLAVGWVELTPLNFLAIWFSWNGFGTTWTLFNTLQHSVYSWTQRSLDCIPRSFKVSIWLISNRRKLGSTVVWCGVWWRSWLRYFSKRRKNPGFVPGVWFSEIFTLPRPPVHIQ